VLVLVTGARFRARTVQMSSTRPTAKEQLQLFKKFNDDGLFAVDSCKVGDFWWVVSLAWFNQWKAHVDWHGDGEAAGERRAPGPIDNSDIQAKGFAKNTTRLRPGLALEADYTILPDAVWTKFVEWYTIVEAQSPGVRRSVAGAKEKIVEVSAPVFDLLFASEAWLGGDPDEAIEIVVSKYQKLDSLIDAIIAQLAIDRDLSPSDVPDTQNIRLWFSLGKGKKYHLVPQDDDFMNSVMLLTPPGSDVGVCRVPAPRLLVDLREVRSSQSVQACCPTELREARHACLNPRRLRNCRLCRYACCTLPVLFVDLR